MGAVSGKKLEPVRCGACEFSSKMITKVEAHIVEAHGKTAKQLYDELNGGPSRCACGCGGETTFINWKNGYSRMIKGHNASIYAVYDAERAEELARTRGSNWKSGSWARGLSKETDERIAERGRRTSEGRKASFASGSIRIWSEGLSKETDERLKRSSETLRLGYQSGSYVPWAKGLSKETDERVQNMSLKVSLAHQRLSLRARLDEQKRLRSEEVKQRVEASGRLTLIEGVEDYVNDNTPTLKVMCKKCGEAWFSTLRRLQYGRCFSCDPGGSIAQHDVKAWIETLGIDVSSNRRDVIDGLELDIFVPSRKFAVEYNGLYWHSIVNKSAAYHEEKTSRCSARGITLMHIFEDEWRDKRSIVQSMIKHRLGLSSRRIGARNCDVVELNAQERKKFFNDNHVDGDTNSTFSFGLAHEGSIVAGMSLRHPFHKSRSSSLEVARFCTLANTNVVGALSKLTAASQKKGNVEGYSSLLSYVDTRLGTREGWTAAGWKMVGNTPPRFWWTDFTERYNRFKYKADSKNNLTELQVAERAQVVKIYGCRNLVYELGTK